MIKRVEIHINPKVDIASRPVGAYLASVSTLSLTSFGKIVPPLISIVYFETDIEIIGRKGDYLILKYR